MERWAFSDVNPWMWWVKPMADWVRANRQPVAPDNPFVQLEKKVSGQIEEALDRYRDARDAASERLFKALYESPWLSAAVGILPGSRASAARAPTWEREELKRLKLDEIAAWVETGTLVDAWARLLLYLGREDKIADERPFNLLRKMLEETKPENIPSLAALKAALKRQAYVLALHEERAIAALPALAPDTQLRRRGYDAAQDHPRARRAAAPGRAPAAVAKILDLEDKPAAQELKSA